MLKLLDRILAAFKPRPKSAEDIAAEQEAKRVWHKHETYKWVSGNDPAQTDKRDW
jgi:hypothetical protein